MPSFQPALGGPPAGEMALLSTFPAGEAAGPTLLSPLLLSPLSSPLLDSPLRPGPTFRRVSHADASVASGAGKVGHGLQEPPPGSPSPVSLTDPWLEDSCEVLEHLPGSTNELRKGGSHRPEPSALASTVALGSGRQRWVLLGTPGWSGFGPFEAEAGESGQQANRQAALRPFVASPGRVESSWVHFAYQKP